MISFIFVLISAYNLPAQVAGIINALNVNLQGAPNQDCKNVPVITLGITGKVLINQEPQYLVQTEDYADLLHGNKIRFINCNDVGDGEYTETTTVYSSPP